MNLEKLLLRVGIKPASAKLARHRPHPGLAELVTNDRGKFEEWQSIQKNRVFERRDIIVACWHLPNQARIFRLYEKVGREKERLLDEQWMRRGFISRDVLNAMRLNPDYDRGRLRYFYHLRPMRRYPDLEGRVIEWSGATWHQNADSRQWNVLPVVSGS